MGWRDHYDAAGAARYDRTWANFTARMLAPVVDLAVPLLRPGARLLDAGCGTGILLEHLQTRQSGMILTGGDRSPAMLDRARERLGGAVRLIPFDFDAAPTDHPTLPRYDLITCTNVLHYLQDPARTCRLFASLLAPGGAVILADFVRHGFWWPAFELLLRAADRHHYRTVRPAEIARYLQTAGLQSSTTRVIAASGPWQGYVVLASDRSI